MLIVVYASGRSRSRAARIRGSTEGVQAEAATNLTWDKGKSRGIPSISPSLLL
jgi:hypothetical protein